MRIQNQRRRRNFGRNLLIIDQMGVDIIIFLVSLQVIFDVSEWVIDYRRLDNGILLLERRRRVPGEDFEIPGEDRVGVEPGA